MVASNNNKRDAVVVPVIEPDWLQFLLSLLLLFQWSGFRQLIATQYIHERQGARFEMSSNRYMKRRHLTTELVHLAELPAVPVRWLAVNWLN